MSDPLGLYTDTSQDTTKDPLGVMDVAPPPQTDPLGIMGGEPEPADSYSFDRAVTMASQYAGQTKLTFGQRHPIMDYVIQTGKHIAYSIEQFAVAAVKNAADANYRQRASIMGGLPDNLTPEGQVDPTQPIRTRDYYETYGEFLQRRGAEGDEESVQQLRDIFEGGAWVATWGVGKATNAGLGAVGARMAPAIGPRTLLATRLFGAAGRPFLRPWARFLTGELIGGSIFGAMRGTEEGETRLQAVLGDAGMFAAFGLPIHGAFHFGGKGLSWALRKVMLRMPPDLRAKAGQAAIQGLREADTEIAAGNNGDGIAGLPAAEQDRVASAVYADAILKADPAMIDLDELARAELVRDLEPHPRGVEHETFSTVTEGAVQTAEGHIERQLGLPDIPLTQVLQLSEPAKLTGAGVGEIPGIVKGPGVPERVVPRKVLEATTGLARSVRIAEFPAGTVVRRIVKPTREEWSQFLTLIKKYGFDTSVLEPKVLRNLDEPPSWADFFKRQPIESRVNEPVRRALRELGYTDVAITDPYAHAKVDVYPVETVAERYTTQPASVPANALTVEKDGSVTVEGYRGVIGTQGATEAGVQPGIYIAQDLRTAGIFFNRFRLGESARPGTLAHLRVRMKNPKIIDSWDEILTEGVNPITVAELRAIRRMNFPTPTEIGKVRASIQTLLSQPKAIERLKARGHDGIVVLQGYGGDAEFVAFESGQIETLKTITGFDLIPPESRKAMMMAGREYGRSAVFQGRDLVLDFDTWVLNLVKQGRSMDEAIEITLRDFRNFGIHGPVEEPIIRHAWKKLAEFLGDRVQPMIDKNIIGYKADIMARLERIKAGQRAEETIIDAIEPRQVTLPTPPPKGFEPTGIGGEVSGAEGEIVQAGLLDAGADGAASDLEKVMTVVPEMRSESNIMLEAIGDPAETSIEPITATGRAIDKALERDEPAATQGILLDLTYPQPYEVSIERTVSKADRAYVRRTIRQSLKRERAPIEIDEMEQIEAPYAETPESTINPKADMLSVLARLDDSQLDAITESMRKGLSGQAGAASARLLATIVGGGAFGKSFDEDLSPGTQHILRTVGAILLAGAAYPAMKNFTRKYMRSFLLNANPTMLFAKAGDKEAAQQLVEAITGGRALGHAHAVDIRKFANPKNFKSIMLLVEEADPTKAAEWHLLSPNEQKMVRFLNTFNKQLGVMLKQQGVIDDYVENYMRHQLPPETFQRWKTNGYRVLPTGGSLTQRRRITDLRSLELWAQQQNLPGPIYDLPTVQARHIEDAYRMMGTSRMIQMLEKIGTIQKMKGNVFTPPPPGMKQLAIAGYGDKMAPEEVATALYNLSDRSASRHEVLTALDKIKSVWMRSIMMWFWEHGANVMRMLPALTMNPAGYIDAYKAVARNDRVLVHAAKYGLNIFDRPDYVPLTAGAFERAINHLGPAAPTLQALRKAGAHLIERQDRILWDNIVPALQLFAWQNQMAKWTQRTGGKFLQGSAEYTAAARDAAKFANTAAGKLPLTFSNPRFLQFMRLVMFSPQWTTTRLALTAHAAGELSEIMAGRLSPAATTYLPLKLRQMAWLAGITWAGSHLMTGEDPDFNPNTNKFYMKTGLYINGHEVGLDLAGWWQDDLRLVGAPLDYLYNRLNPTFKLTYETISGRDYLGRELNAAGRIANILGSFGPPSEVTALGMRALSGNPPGGGELLQRGLGVAAFGNVAQLPRPIDSVMSKLAERMLRNTGVPATNDNIFELSRLLRSNFMQGHPFLDNRVMTFLAYRRRGAETRDPLGTGIESLFGVARRILVEH